VPGAATSAALAGRLAKADLATDMVREFTNLQGTMGGIYAREEGHPSSVWKAIYYHYLPVAVDAEAPPTRAQLGDAAEPWAAVSIADKLDTLVGLFAAGERPTGSRDPFGLRRQAHGLFKVLADLPELTGLTVRPAVGTLLDAAEASLAGSGVALDETSRAALLSFLGERLTYVLEQRGYDVRNVRAVMAGRPVADISPLEARRMLEGAARIHRHEGVPAAGDGLQAREEHREGAAGCRVPGRGGRRAHRSAPHSASRRSRRSSRSSIDAGR
jgi:glycyl-tRNA synthetase beta chain